MVPEGDLAAVAMVVDGDGTVVDPEGSVSADWLSSQPKTSSATVRVVAISLRTNITTSTSIGFIRTTAWR
jgi:hypothetical protein